MFFYLSKIFWYLLQPLVCVILLLALALVAALMGWRRSGIALGGAAFTVLAITALTPLGLLLMSPLENRIERPELPANVAGIIILGGALDTRVAGTRNEPELNEAADRISEAVVLARRYPNAKVVFSGGSAELLFDTITEADASESLLLALGIAPERLLLEDQSRNTHENARYTLAMANPQPGETWLLVTSAFHMPRALGCFRKAGFSVLPYPVDYRTPSGSAIWIPSTSSIRNVEKVHFALREYIGLFVYWMTGRTDALFPAA